MHENMVDLGACTIFACCLYCLCVLCALRVLRVVCIFSCCFVYLCVFCVLYVFLCVVCVLCVFCIFCVLCVESPMQKFVACKGENYRGGLWTCVFFGDRRKMVGGQTAIVPCTDMNENMVDLGACMIFACYLCYLCVLRVVCIFARVLHLQILRAVCCVCFHEFQPCDPPPPPHTHPKCKKIVACKGERYRGALACVFF